MKHNEASIAAHNLALILTQASINEVEKEQLPISVNNATLEYLRDISNKYAFIYDKFYTYAMNHFESVLNDDE